MSTEANLCARCGQPAKGQAVIDSKRYCHDGDDPTCYMLESWELAGKPRFKARLCPKHGIYRDATKESVIND